MTIVGVGGIDSPDSAWNAITSGAEFNSVVFWFSFQRAWCYFQYCQRPQRRYPENGFGGISEAIGCNHR